MMSKMSLSSTHTKTVRRWVEGTAGREGRKMGREGGGEEVWRELGREDEERREGQGREGKKAMGLNNNFSR